MRYRRARMPGATYFFTVVTYQRQQILHLPDNITLLRQAFRHVKQRHPFNIDAIAILPDHLHCLWTLPPDSADFSTRWRLIKQYFSRSCQQHYKQPRSRSRIKKQEQAVWQRRFWEHQIRDDRDFSNHVDYIHFNPVKHGLVTAAREWPYSSFRRFVEAGQYEEDWGMAEMSFPVGVGFE
ncbi:transposase [Desertifilum sp. FACHB-1129]|uniref:Transposase n=1 Tax=Desertifilum tharense IPPAS B-1220 TaxID=1781255 RepID=A0A1E5QQT0_9CYAN|nr:MULTISPECIES: transposase [Desertifilum]MBD2314354.1 transposase [Desertifilum sp. FACHB-1129]MBD2323287.1 transposase [Desertifilum sp. FACHB-866]MBD2333132.1 transposase [Desertifilum sp. FACHB-868]OEJ76964.1 transposase [Desertifilum tharense IPPAS B-1220]